MSSRADNVQRICLEAKASFNEYIDFLVESAQESKQSGKEIIFEEAASVFIYTLSEVLQGYHGAFEQCLKIEDAELRNEKYFGIIQAEPTVLISILTEKLHEISKRKRAG